MQDEEKKFLDKFNLIFKLSETNPDKNNLPFDYLRKSPDVLMLINLSLREENSILRNLCYHNQMNHFWDEVWKHMGKNPTFPESKRNPNTKYEPLRPQNRLLSYDLVCGMSLYNKTYHQPQDMHLEMLHQAAVFHNFAALESLAHLYGKQLTASMWINPEFCLTPLIKSAEIHGAPAYILCAEIFMDYSGYYFKHSNLINYQKNLREALTCLTVAKLLEHHCENEIHNAYYGKNDFQLLLNNAFSKICIHNPDVVAKCSSDAELIAKRWITDDRAFIVRPKQLH